MGTDLLSNPLFIASFIIFLVLIAVFLRGKRNTALDMVLDQYDKEEAKSQAKKATEEYTEPSPPPPLTVKSTLPKLKFEGSTPPSSKDKAPQPSPTSAPEKNVVKAGATISHNEDPVPGHGEPVKKKKFISEGIPISHNEDQITAESTTIKNREKKTPEAKRNTGYTEDFYASPKSPSDDMGPNENWIEATIPGLIIEPLPDKKPPPKKPENTDDKKSGEKTSKDVLTFKAAPKAKRQPVAKQETAQPKQKETGKSPDLKTPPAQKPADNLGERKTAKLRKQTADTPETQESAKPTASSKAQTARKDEPGKSKSSDNSISKPLTSGAKPLPGKGGKKSWEFPTGKESRKGVKKKDSASVKEKAVKFGEPAPIEGKSSEKDRKIVKNEPKAVEIKAAVVSHKDEAKKPDNEGKSNSSVTKDKSAEPEKPKPRPFFLDLKYLVEEELEAAGPKAPEKLSPEMVDRIVARLGDLQVNLESQLVSMLQKDIPKETVKEIPPQGDMRKQRVIKSSPVSEGLPEDLPDKKEVSMEELDAFLFTDRQRKTR